METLKPKLLLCTLGWLKLCGTNRFCETSFLLLFHSKRVLWLFASFLIGQQLFRRNFSQALISNHKLFIQWIHDFWRYLIGVRSRTPQYTHTRRSYRDSNRFIHFTLDSVGKSVSTMGVANNNEILGWIYQR